MFKRISPKFKKLIHNFLAKALCYNIIKLSAHVLLIALEGILKFL